FALALDRSLGYDESGNCLGEIQTRNLKPPQELHWELPPQVSGVLPQARQQFQALAEGLQLHVVSIEDPPGPPGTPEEPQELLPLALELALVRVREKPKIHPWDTPKFPKFTPNPSGMRPVPTRLFLEGPKTHLRPPNSIIETPNSILETPKPQNFPQIPPETPPKST
ncbi:hypothetical protein HGM15179_022097, partial [Zosterops borbonicus]